MSHARVPHTQPTKMLSLTAKAEAPYFTMVPPHCVWTTAGYSIILNCSAGGFPPPRIQWRKNMETSPINTTQVAPCLHSSSIPQQITLYTLCLQATGGSIPHFSQLPDGSLQINTAQVKDKGVYTCIAWNNLGEKSASVRVKVRGETEICGVTVASQAETREKRVVQGQVVSTVQDHPWQVRVAYLKQCITMCSLIIIVYPTRFSLSTQGLYLVWNSCVGELCSAQIG